MSAVDWFESKSFGVQLITLAAILDPLGAILGHFLLPQFGVEPLMGAVYGLVAAGIPLSLWLTTQKETQSA